MQKVSIIFPCYNSEKTIRRAIESIINQSYKNIEIVAIDDGSNDATPQLLYNYSKEYPFIKYKSNGRNYGAGYTKNIGVSMSSGDYISFVDSDDYIEPDYIESLYKTAVDTGADIVCANIATVEDEQIIKHSILDNNLLFFSGHPVYAYKNAVILPPEIFIGHWAAASACTKLFKRDSIVKFPFYEGMADDLASVVPAVSHSRKIAICPMNYYYYCSRPDSLERREFSEDRLSIADSFLTAIGRISSSNNCLLHKQLFFVNCILPTIIHSFNITNQQKRNNFLREFYSRLYSSDFLRLFDFVENPYILKYLLSFTDSKWYYFTLFNLFRLSNFEKLENIFTNWGNRKEEYTCKDAFNDTGNFFPLTSVYYESNINNKIERGLNGSKAFLLSKWFFGKLKGLVRNIKKHGVFYTARLLFKKTGNFFRY